MSGYIPCDIYNDIYHGIYHDIWTCYIPCYISYYSICHIFYLGIFSSKAMSIQIKGITSRLRTSYVIITFPLKCGICSKMVSVTARHRDKVAGQNAVQLCNSPLSALFVWNCQFNCHGFSKILGKFWRQPAKNRMCLAVRVCHPLWIINRVAQELNIIRVRVQGQSLQAFSLQQMNVQCLLSKVMMISGRLDSSSISQGAFSLAYNNDLSQAIYHAICHDILHAI